MLYQRDKINYLNSMTPEEQKEQAGLTTVTTVVTQESKNWEKRFDKKFGYFEIGAGPGKNNYTPEDVKSFVRNFLENASICKYCKRGIVCGNCCQKYGKIKLANPRPPNSRQSVR